MAGTDDEPGTSKPEKPQLFTTNVSSLFALKAELYRKKQESRLKSATAVKPKKV